LSVLLSQVNLRVIGVGAYYYAVESVRNGQSYPLDMGAIAATQGVDPQFFINPRGSSPPPPAVLLTPDQQATGSIPPPTIFTSRATRRRRLLRRPF
jgi:hypothetical protein